MSSRLFKYAASRDEMYNFDLPRETTSYKPVPHRQIIESVLEGAYKQGIPVISETYRANKEGRQVQGEFRLKYGDDKDMCPMIVFQNSYDKSMSLKVAIGNQVFVCTNGAVWGDMGAMRHKHVGEIQTITPTTIQTYFDEVEGHYMPMIRRKERMKTIDVDRHLAAQLVGELFLNEGLVNSEQLMIIKGQVEKPSYDYQAPGSLYEFWNHVTHAYKWEHPGNFLKNQLGLSAFLEDRFDLAVRRELLLVPGITIGGVELVSAVA